MTKPDPKLEIHDALETISQWAIFHAGDRYDEARKGATQILFEELLEVGRQIAGLTVTRFEDRGLVLAFEQNGTFEVVLFQRGSYLYIARRGKGQRESMLERVRFNGVTGRWQSVEPDTFWVPTPGEPRRWRSAAAQILEEAAPLMQDDPVDIP